MTQQAHLLLLIGLIMVTSSFSMYHFVNAQNNSSEINVENGTVQPVPPRASLNNTQQNIQAIDNLNNWTVISGNWTTLNNNLLGSSSGNSTSPLHNIILNPIEPENLTAISTYFKVNNLENTTANYASIVYSFIDTNDYKLAGINIFKDKIYAVGYTINDGNQVAEPSWPGIKTNLTWSPGALYNVTLVHLGSSLDLFVNGTSYLTLGMNAGHFNTGEIGLNYGRIQNISFTDYNTRTGTADQQLSSNSGQDNTNSDSFSIDDSATILLESKSLPENSYIHLYDSSPYQIKSGHIAAKLPCSADNATEVNVLVGQAPRLAPIELEFIPDLSTPDEMCLYHGDLNFSETNPVTDIAIANNSTDDIEFPDTSSVVISVNEISRIE